jgi:hypothetical protein
MLNGRPFRPYHDAASRLEITDLSEQHQCIPGFSGMRVAQSCFVNHCLSYCLFLLPHFVDHCLSFFL